MNKPKVYKGKLKIKGKRKGAYLLTSRETILDNKMHTLYRKVDKDGLHWAVTKRGSSIVQEVPIKAIKLKGDEPNVIYEQSNDNDVDWDDVIQIEE